MRNLIGITFLILIILAGYLFWRQSQSPEAREASLRTAMEHHDEKAAEKILNK